MIVVALVGFALAQSCCSEAVDLGQDSGAGVLVADSDRVVEEMWDQYVKAETRSVGVLVVLAEEVLLVEADSALVDDCEVEGPHLEIDGTS